MLCLWLNLCITSVEMLVIPGTDYRYYERLYISLCLKVHFKSGAESCDRKNIGFRAKYLYSVVHSLLCEFR